MKRVSIAVIVAPMIIAASSVFAHDAPEQSIALLSARIRDEPQNGRLHLERGEIYRSMRRFGEAHRDYEKARTLEASNEDSDLCSGRAWLEEGDHAAAVEALDRYLACRPDDAGARVLLARALAELGRHAEAADAYRHATELHGRAIRPEVYLERARAIERAGGPASEALACLSEGIERLGPIITLEMAAIDLAVRHGDLAEALSRVDRIVTLLPRKEEWLARRAEILARAGRVEPARHAYREALAALGAVPAARRTRSLEALRARIESGLRALNAEER